MIGKLENMVNLRPLTIEGCEVRELTGSDFESFVPFSALPTDLQQLLSSEKCLVPDAEMVVKQQSVA
jgi:hypothetical protein